MSMRDGDTIHERRSHCRRSVLWQCELSAGDYLFDCSLLNISLSGARLHLDLPLKRGAAVVLTFQKLGQIPAKVSWHRGDQVGLKFQIPAEDVCRRLGKAVAERLGLDRPL